MGGSAMAAMVCASWAECTIKLHSGFTSSIIIYIRVGLLLIQLAMCIVGLEEQAPFGVFP